MHRIARSLAAVGVVVLSLSCADKSTGLRASGMAWLPISPVFVTAPAGGPRIDIALVHGVLKRPGAADSNVASAAVQGDSAILEFPRVIVLGDSSTYALEVRAFDPNDELVFKALKTVTVRPGDNAPTVPVLQYIAADASVESINVRSGTQDVADVPLDWAGADPANTSCLNRVPSATATTQIPLNVMGTADNGAVPNVRVGWTSRDTTVATVDAAGVVRARCSNRSTYVVARTFLDVADSVRIDVTAPPFTLLMTPETVALPRGDSIQLAAMMIDENGNQVTTTTGVNWTSSDSSLATVSAAGLVRGVANGRVLVTASSGSRTTVAVVNVIPPKASSVVITPAVDTLVVGQSRVFSARAFDASGSPIVDASNFFFASDNAGIARVSAAGVVTGVAGGNARIVVMIDGKKDTALVHVRIATDGIATGRVLDAATGRPVVGASISGQGNPATSDADGVFMTAPQTPPTELQFSATGYVGFIYYAVPIQLGQTVDLRDLPMAPTSTAAATLTGTIVNALDDAPVAGALVKIYPGINPPSANPSSGATSPASIAQTSTDASGTFTFLNVPAGTYTYSVTSSGFSFTRRVVVAVGSSTQTMRIPLAPVIVDGANGLRIVLSWGDCADGTSNLVPCDLDSHLTGPASEPDVGRFHVAYFNEAYLRGLDTVAVLDNDATGGLGPETVTLRPVTAGTYKYYVHNYSDGSDTTSVRLTTAQARVDVFRGTNLIASFFPPANQAGTVWAVFQFDGTTITPVNSILRIQDLSEVPGDFLRAPDAERDELQAIVQRRLKRP